MFVCTVCLQNYRLDSSHRLVWEQEIDVLESGKDVVIVTSDWATGTYVASVQLGEREGLITVLKN